MEKELYEKFHELQEKHCWFVGKQKLINTLLQNYIYQEDNLILDAGCGIGAILKTIQKFGKVIELDNSKLALKFCKNKCTSLICGSLPEVPVKSNSFQHIILVDVLEHISDDTGTLKELNRVLKKEGFLFIMTSAFKFLWGKHDVINHHKRRYIKKELKEKIEIAGFHILRITYSNILFFPVFAIFRILEKINVFKFKTELDIKIPLCLNKILNLLLSFDRYLLKKFDFPFGISLVCIAKKV